MLQPAMLKPFPLWVRWQGEVANNSSNVRAGHTPCRVYSTNWPTNRRAWEQSSAEGKNEQKSSRMGDPVKERSEGRRREESHPS